MLLIIYFLNKFDNYNLLFELFYDMLGNSYIDSNRNGVFVA